MATFFRFVNQTLTFGQTAFVKSPLVIAAGNAITFSQTLTATGVIMGTAANTVTFSHVLTGGYLLSSADPGDYMLVDENNATTNCFLVKLAGGITGSVVSAGFGTAQSNNNDMYGSLRNRAIQPNTTDVYVVLTDGIYKSTDSGATFSLEQAFSTISSTTNGKYVRSGLYYVVDGSQRLLSGFFRNSSSLIAGYTYNIDTAAYVESTAVAASAGSNAYTTEYFWDNIIYAVTNTGANPGGIYWDALNGKIGNFVVANDVETEIGGSNAFCVTPDGRLLCTYRQGTLDKNRIALILGGHGVPANPGSTTNSTNFSSSLEDRPGLWVDQKTGDLMWLELDSDGQTGAVSVGWTLHQIPPPYNTVGNDITDQCLPDALRGSFRTGGSASNDDDKRVMITHDTNVLSSEVSTFAYFSEGVVGTAQPTCYQYMGPGTPFRLVGVVTGGDVSMSYPLGHGSSMRTLITSNRIEILGHSVTGSTEVVSFRCSGGGLKTVRFWWNRNGQPAQFLATLTGSVTGGFASRSGNTVIDVNCNGFTVYTCEWFSSFDEVLSGEPHIVLEGDVF